MFLLYRFWLTMLQSIYDSILVRLTIAFIQNGVSLKCVDIQACVHIVGAITSWYMAIYRLWSETDFGDRASCQGAYI
jgi:hypothetical protein